MTGTQAFDRSSIQAIRAWFDGPLGQLLLEQQGPLLEQELQRCFGRYLLHYGYSAGPLLARNLGCHVRLGPTGAAGDILCDESAWPIGEHAADAVVLQHGLDFCRFPHQLLREAAHSVRPGGYLLVVGLNPWSSWGVRRSLSRDAFGQARGISAGRVCDWLSLLGFSLEKRSSGCYRPPLASKPWQQRLAGLESRAGDWQLPGAGFYLLCARKMTLGLRPLRPAWPERRGKLLPMPVARAGSYSCRSEGQDKPAD